MLLKKGEIFRDLIMFPDEWRHTGFNVFVGPRILPGHQDAVENLARYIIHAALYQGRTTYMQETGQVKYRPKDGPKRKMFDALE